jgi:chromosome segregation ATPase
MPQGARRQSKTQQQLALSQAAQDNQKLRDEIARLDQRVGEKSRTITHMESNMTDLKEDTAKQIEDIRAEAEESDKLKDELLTFGTKAVQDLRVRLEALQAEKTELNTIHQERKKSLADLQDAYFSTAPEQTRLEVEAFSAQILELV